MGRRAWRRKGGSFPFIRYWGVKRKGDHPPPTPNPQSLVYLEKASTNCGLCGHRGAEVEAKR